MVGVNSVEILGTCVHSWFLYKSVVKSILEKQYTVSVNVWLWEIGYEISDMALHDFKHLHTPARKRCTT